MKRTPLKRMSQKRRAALGDRRVFSTVRKKPRSKSERERIYGPPGYVEWIHEQPCVACGVVGFSVTAHLGNGGTGRKSDWTRTIPLCGSQMQPKVGCHTLLDDFPWVFSAKYPAVDLDYAAIKNHERWLSTGVPK